MSRISPIHWKKFERFLLSIGCKLEREHGDHRIYWRNNLRRPVVIPRDKELPVFIIRNNLRLLNISSEQYLKIIENL